MFWPLFRFSPLIMLVGVIAGGWLIVRSILTWGVGGPDYPFAADIPISAVVVALWAAASMLILVPPSSVLARQGQDVAGPALVWPLGQRFRVWNLLAIPVTGVVGFLATGAVVAALQSGSNAWFAIPMTVALAAFSVALIWMVLRCMILGVEITPARLHARGYFRTTSFPREEIADVAVVPLTLWQSYLLEKVTNRVVDSTIELSLRDGSRHRLLASNSTEDDLEVGALIVREWSSLRQSPTDAA